MKLFGLTGGIASGKSTVANMLRAAGIPVIDADQLARDVVAPGTDGLAEIVERFGNRVLDATGALDRARVGEIVFSDAEQRRRLNAIVHPRVAALAAERTQGLAAAGHAHAVYEVPLLFENGLDGAMDASVLVAVPTAVQLARVIARDGLTPDAAQARIDAQMSLDDKRARASWVIDNSGRLEETAVQLSLVWAELTGVPVDFATKLDEIRPPKG